MDGNDARQVSDTSNRRIPMLNVQYDMPTSSFSENGGTTIISMPTPKSEEATGMKENTEQGIPNVKIDKEAMENEQQTEPSIGNTRADYCGSPKVPEDKVCIDNNEELFGDTDAMEVIQALTDPKEIKDIGRKVKGLSFKIWKESAMAIVREGNLAKFSQNEKLKDKLISTYPKELVEASPYDPVWGIGLAEDWEQSYSKETWRGLNLLGYILTDIRNELMKKKGIIDEQGVVPVDLEALKARYVASGVSDDGELEVASVEEQLCVLDSIQTPTGPAVGGNDGKESSIEMEMETATDAVKEMNSDDNKDRLDFV